MTTLLIGSGRQSTDVLEILAIFAAHTEYGWSTALSLTLPTLFKQLSCCRCLIVGACLLAMRLSILLCVYDVAQIEPFDRTLL